MQKCWHQSLSWTPLKAPLGQPAWHWLRDDSNSVCLAQITLFVCYSSGWSSDCSVMAEAPSKGSGWRPDNLGNCAELGWMFCRKGSVQEPLVCQLITVSHTHTHMLQRPPPNCFSAFVRTFSKQTDSYTHTESQEMVHVAPKQADVSCLLSWHFSFLQKLRKEQRTSSSSSSPPICVTHSHSCHGVASL